MYEFRLYIANGNPRTSSTIENIMILLKEELNDEFNIEIMDVQKHSDSVKEYDVVVTPTLVKTSPPPLIKVIGDLNDKKSVLIGLGLSSDKRQMMEND